ncbi:hypothetical protein K1719_033355 [Acacia pycnantha]|nr:hypothetical protein K1719_033355 [Acacia pycnantha]
MPQASASAKCNFQIDVFMMAQGAASGTLRTHQDFFNLAKAVGFKGVQFQYFVRNFWVMEFFKSGSRGTCTNYSRLQAGPKTAM